MTISGPPPIWPTRAGDPALVEARLQAHHATRLLAAFAGGFLEPREDDSHRSLSWNMERRALATGMAAGDDGPIAVGLAIDAMQLVLLRGDVEDGRVDLCGRTLEEARRWLVDRVCGAGSGSLAWPEFDIPPHPVADGARFDVGADESARLADWYDAAAWALAPAAAREGAGALRCWPHHFDIATLISLSATQPDGTAPTVGVGMSPGDGDYPEPYGYVSPWPSPWSAPRPNLEFGHWHTDGWLAAILPSTEWVGAAGPDVVRGFFAQAADVATTLVT